MRRSIFCLLTALAFAACSRAENPWSASEEMAPTGNKVLAALASPERPASERARDSERHPSETLAFFGLRDSMRVIEISPGTGFYTAILAPVLRDRGTLTVIGPDANGPADFYGTKQVIALQDRFAKSPETYGLAWLKPWHPPYDVRLGDDNSADMVLTFRNLHGWAGAGIHDKVLASAFRVLRPGGILGIVDHRAAPGTSVVEATKKGYLPEAFVVEAAQQAGFVLSETSEINANERDTRDHPEGVWTLPPTLRLGDKDRAKYTAIGESDRMTLRFVKPFDRIRRALRK